MKNRTFITFIFATVITLSLLMASKYQAIKSFAEDTHDVESETREESAHKPSVNEIKEICSLVSLECYYHNMAKSVKEKGTGLTHLGEQDRTFWIEYTGVVQISYEGENISMTQEDNTIYITLPQPTVTCFVDPESWNEDSYVISKDSGINKNHITANDQTTAVSYAMEQMEEDVKNNSSILNTANMQARHIIENYINQFGEAIGTEYTIVWL